MIVVVGVIIMMKGQQKTPRKKLQLYFNYVIDKADKGEHFNYMKSPSSQEEEPGSPYRGIRRTLSPKKQPRQVSKSSVLEPRSVILRKSGLSTIEQPESASKNGVKLPPIRRETKQQGDEDEWRKYYHVHNMETIKMDESTIKLMEFNQRKNKLKRRQSLRETSQL